MDITFEQDDQLKRAIFGRKLYEVINASDNIRDQYGTFVIALDSSWGTGKSTFLEKWKNQLIKDHKLEVVLYNAWTNDDFGSPLISILANLIEECDKRKTISEKSKKEIKRKAIELSKYIVKKSVSHIIKSKLGLNIDVLMQSFTEKTGAVISTEDCEEISKIAMSNNEEDSFEDYYKYKELKERFIELLNEISTTDKTVFIIDELDRCNPLYAIEVLETMKHFFGVPNIVFVVAVDLDQLSHSIATVYGQNMDSSGYLRRFFDVQLRLPEPNQYDYIKYIFEVNGIQLKNRVLIESAELSAKLNLSLRDINRVAKNLRLMSLMSGVATYKDDYLIVYTYLMMLKYKHTDIFKTVMKKRFLNEGNGSTGTYEVLEDRFFKPTLTVKAFMDAVCNDQMKKTLKEFINGDGKILQMFFVDSDLDAQGFDFTLPLYQFLERKLELYY